MHNVDRNDSDINSSSSMDDKENFLNFVDVLIHDAFFFYLSVQPGFLKTIMLQS